MTAYRIREVDGFDDEVAETLHALHTQTSDFPAITPDDLENGRWWLGLRGQEPVSMAGIISSTHYPRTAYFKRVHVLHGHRGHGLQLRHMRVIEHAVRRSGWSRIVSDTTETVHSANNFIRAGYRLFDPAFPWAFPNTLYWTKNIGA